MKLNDLYNNFGSKKAKKRVGRGIGSGKGKTCGVGVKGQKARTGVAIKGFEGGQMPMIKRLPKRGFNCPTTKKYNTINVVDIEALVQDKRVDGSKTVTKQSLYEAGLLKNPKVLVKLLAAGGKVETKLSIQLDACSGSAKAIVEAAGGQIVLV
jgi:large subunit ribosomal protein L15